MKHGIKISCAQFEALLAANKTRLQYSVCGWTADGSRGFQTGTVKKLHKLGLLSFLPPEHSSRSRTRGHGSYLISGLGIKTLDEEQRKLAAGHPAAFPQGEAA